ncbi:MAG TPA: SemiSWEET family transporter [Dermatophilaceae bacterium]
MSIEIVLAIVASSFGVVMGLAPLLQIRRMLAERSSRDVSIGYFAIIALGSALWGSYGVSIRNVAIVIPNAVGFLVTIATILVAHRLRRNDRLNQPEPSDREGAREVEGAADGTGDQDDPASLPDPQIVWQSAE